MTKITFNYRKHLKWQGAILMLLFFFGLKGFSQENLITNGDMESSGGWQVWNYGFINPATGTSSPAQYARVTNSQQFNSNFVNATARSGSGNFLAFDMLLSGGQQHFFGVGNNGGGICALSTTVTHTFSYWVRTLSNGTRAEIDVLFNNASNVQLISGSKTTPDVNDGWQQVVYTFTPTNNCVNITLRHTNANNLADGLGNDFALDDFSLTAPPAPLTIEFFSNPASCPGNNDAYIEASRFGGTGPFSYDLLNSLGATVATNAEGNFINLAPDTYTVRVSDGLGATATTPNIQLQAPTEITTSPNVTICNGSSTNLSVSGSTSTYTWTAQPADGSITDPSLPNQSVSPTQTTIYTVTSTVVTNSSDALNLLTNGGFGAGNNGFETDYNFTPDNTIAKAQKAYGIVSNPKAWEPDFSTCTDRSTDNDLMMVVDGSATAANNDRVWSQTVNGLKQNTDYIFSYWVQSVAALSPANLETQINGSVVGTALAPSTACGWIRRFYRWNSGASNSAIITIIDRNTVVAGNDFALDEMSFAEAIICNLEKSVTVTVNPIVEPTFSFDSTYDVGEVPVALPATSDNGITGTWSPATIDTSVAGSVNYAFTPNDPTQCGAAISRAITVNNTLFVDPTFTLPAIICRGTVVNLPITSDNGIIGTWNPASVDNTQSASYLFTPDAGQNANTFAYNLTVNQPVVPTFNNLPSNTACENGAVGVLPTASVEGITGTWSGVLDSSILGLTTYTFTPDAGQCASSVPFEFTVTAPTVPTFNNLPSNTACQNSVVGALPTVSVEGFTGAWSSAVDTSVVGLTTYTFTPDAGQCAASTTFDLTVSAPTVSTFNNLPSNTTCQNSVVGALPTVSAEGFTGSWSPAVDTSVVGLTTYTFTPDAGQCAASTTFDLTVTAPTVSTFNNLPSNTTCQNSVVGALPIVSAEGFTGTWSPAVDTSIAGLTTYTFTPDAGQCAAPATFDLTVTIPTVPTFNNLPSNTTCLNGTVGVLPTVSTEGITGTWSGVLDSSVLGVTTYTFTPDAGQCASSVPFNFTVTPLTVPMFNNLPSNTTCLNGAVGVLPTVSTEGIVGSWSGALDSTIIGLTTYTFTPNAGQCAAPTTFNFTVNAPTVATFNNFPSNTACQNGAVGVLPTVSTEGITGTWSGALDSTILGLTTYTFTPDAGQCAAPTTFGLTVTAPTTPTFNGMPSATVCQTDPVNAFPTTSIEGVTGTWSPVLDLNVTGLTTYTFTPDAGQCAQGTDFDLTVNAVVTPAFNGLPNPTVCQNENLSALPTTSDNGIVGTWSPALSTATVGATTYTFTPNVGQCANSFPFTLTVNPTITAVAIEGNCEDIEYMVTASPVSNSFDPNTVTYAWTDNSGAPIGNGTSKLNVSALNLSSFPATVYVRITNGSGCSITEPFVVQTDFCEIPKGVSPNGDGKNDTFDLSGLNPKLVQIFNRYGVKVFEGTNYTNQWYGQTNDGDELPAATYYYVAEFNSGETKTGWVYLTR